MFRCSFASCVRLGEWQVAYRVPGAQQAEWVDLYNRLYRERIIFLGQQIADDIANQIIGVMLFLDSEDNTKPVYMYINSPGGSVTSGFAMFDTMRHIKSEVSTINVGLAASMGSFLLAGGAKGKRLALPHSRVMIHQPAAGGIQGQASDIKVEAEQILAIRERVVKCACACASRPPARPPARPPPHRSHARLRRLASRPLCTATTQRSPASPRRRSRAMSTATTSCRRRRRWTMG